MKVFKRSTAAVITQTLNNCGAEMMQREDGGIFPFPGHDMDSLALFWVGWTRTEFCNVTRMPQNWPLPLAAAMTVSLMVGYYSLVEVARLREGQNILVHGAAGLYGQTAIAMAKEIGAKVFATVSTSAQREEFATRFKTAPSSIR